MDPFFHQWLLLRYESSTQRSRFNTMQRLFQKHRFVPTVHLDNDDAMFDFMYQLCRYSSDSFLRVVGISEPVLDLLYKPTTVASYVRCLWDYYLFFHQGHQVHFPRTYEFLRRVELRSRHVEQSTSLISIVAPGYWFVAFNRCAATLLDYRRLYVEPFLVKSMQYQGWITKRKVLKKLQSFLVVAYTMYHRPMLHFKEFVFVPEARERRMTYNGLVKYLTTTDQKRLKTFFRTQTLHTKCTRLYVTRDMSIFTCHLDVSNYKSNVPQFIVSMYPMLTHLGFLFVLIGTMLHTELRRIDSDGVNQNAVWIFRPSPGRHVLDVWRKVIVPLPHEPDEVLIKRLELIHNGQRFPQRLKTMFFAVHTNYDFSTWQPSSVVSIQNLQMVGRRAEYGFVTSSERSIYYQGLSRIKAVHEAVHWWTQLHRTHYGTADTLGVYPLMFSDLYDKGIRHIYDRWMLKNVPHNITKIYTDETSFNKEVSTALRQFPRPFYPRGGFV